MRLQQIACVLGRCALGGGCCSDTFLHYSARVLIETPLECIDECLAQRRNRQWARAAWNRIARSPAGQAYSEDYGCGFRDGFADYLDNGGDKGLVPVVPPLRYRRMGELSPAQYQAAEDWFAGFRHGVAVAQGSGLRMWNVVPTSGEGLAGQLAHPQPAHPLNLAPVEPAHPLPFPPATPTPERLSVPPTPLEPNPPPAKSLRQERNKLRPAPTTVTLAAARPELREDQRGYGEPLRSPYHVLLQSPRPGWDLVAVPFGER